MIRETDISLLPEDLQSPEKIKKKLSRKLKVSEFKIKDFELLKRSIDARKRPVRMQLRYRVGLDEKVPDSSSNIDFPHIGSKTSRVIIVGAGPAGYFAALECIRLGLQPIVLDRGKDVRSRRRDLRAIQQFGEVNPDSNYCFGEGGAGTYSDGKLYTRSHKRGNIKDILELLVHHGAKSDILIDAHPHIGSNKLPGVVTNIRETIEGAGGMVVFDQKVTDLIVENNKILEVRTEQGKQYKGEAYILCTGHSARDIFYLLHEKGVHIESKPFALGLRLEHPQSIIDQIQYGKGGRGEFLPAASYKLTAQVNNRGVYSFCMCPGGLIVPASTSPGELVVNGMSLSRRDSAYANSGVVTEISIAWLEKQGYSGFDAGVRFQREIEQKVFNSGDGTQKAPAQRLTDLLKNKISDSLPSSSYIPGVYSANLNDLLPKSIMADLRNGIKIFGQKMKGYYTEEAIAVAVESRTSCPIRIPRDSDTLMSPQLEAFFPCGEGAGYAGGILSAALDGQRVARAVNKYVTRN